MPTFTLGTWLAGLMLLVAILFLLAPLAYRGAAVVRILALPYAAIMLLNGLGHLAGSVYFSRWLPGATTSPLLIAASIWLLRADAPLALRARQRPANGIVYLGIGTVLVALPASHGSAALTSLIVHTIALTLVAMAAVRAGAVAEPQAARSEPRRTGPAEHVVFIASDGGLRMGGGGGGNRQRAPIRRAEARGTDRVTLRTAAPPAAQLAVVDTPAPVLPHLLLDAVPRASGVLAQMGLPAGGVPSVPATGTGSV